MLLRGLPIVDHRSFLQGADRVDDSLQPRFIRSASDKGHGHLTPTPKNYVGFQCLYLEHLIDDQSVAAASGIK